MLLRHTKGGEIKERNALTINPAKTCQPVGAMYAALGVNKCLPYSHGSQGCCAYHRSSLTRHYKEPVMALTSSFTEGAAVFGGQSNLLQGITNAFTLYDPEIIAVHTTCLSETIGDDIPQIIGKAIEDSRIPKGKYVIHTNTPSYAGSHITGYANMVEGFVKYFAESTGEQKNQVNLIPSFVEPSDMAEIKRIATMMGVKSVMLPDTSGVLNGPMTGKFKMYPDGGTTLAEIKSTGDSVGTISLGKFGAEKGGKALDNKCKVPLEVLDLPIGLKATDRYVDALRKMAGVSIPKELLAERGQVLDMMTDMHQYFFGKRVAIVGDPDTIISLTEFALTLDMKPVYVVTGTPGKAFDKKMAELTEGLDYEVKYKQGKNSDMFLLHQWIKNESVDLIIGNSYTKFIGRDEDIPTVRVGFPIYDRVGHQYFPTVGYKGALRLMEKMLDRILDRLDRDNPEESFELVM